MTELPAPLTPVDCDLRPRNGGNRPAMPINVEEIRSMDWLAATDEVQAVRLSLMAFAWCSNPAGSLPGPVDGLWRLAGMRRSKWKRIGSSVMSAWVRCSDGRIYHPTLAEHASRIWRMMNAERRLSLSSAEWAAIRAAVFQRDDFACQYCGAQGVRLECDHVVPVALGGADDQSNLVTACFRCNRSKGAKPLDVWKKQA